MHIISVYNFFFLYKREKFELYGVILDHADTKYEKNQQPVK
jgi:hypothetical protein